jgi:hypothetical protein
MCPESRFTGNWKPETVNPFPFFLSTDNWQLSTSSRLGERKKFPNYLSQSRKVAKGE